MPDILASKLLTGKSPKIKSAIRFIPESIQDSLTETEIYGVHVNPKTDNLIKVLVERRQEIKNEMKRVPKDSHEYDVLDAQQRALKILNNSTTYGIYIEMHPKDKEKLDVFSKEEFETEGTLESNTIETYPDIEKIREYVLNITPSEARKIGIKYRSTLKKLKERVQEEGFNMNTKEMRKMIST